MTAGNEGAGGAQSTLLAKLNAGGSWTSTINSVSITVKVESINLTTGDAVVCVSQAGSTCSGTAAPVTPSPTKAPVTAAPITPSPTKAPVTAAPITPSPTRAPSTSSPTIQPVTSSPTVPLNCVGALQTDCENAPHCQWSRKAKSCSFISSPPTPTTPSPTPPTGGCGNTGDVCSSNTDCCNTCNRKKRTCN